MRSLTPIQQRVLAEISWDCRSPVTEIAKRLKLKSHAVRYAIEQLNEIIKLHPFCFTNAFRMGLTPFRIYFSINSADKTKTIKMIEHVRRLPELGWFYSLYGYYQFGMSLRVPSMQALNNILSVFDAKFGDIITKKSIAIMSRFSFYEPAAACVGNGPRKAFEYTSDDDPVSLDSTDLNILTVVRSNAAAPVRDIAKRTGLPSSTVTYRLDRLIKNGVIVAFAYTYEDQLTGRESFLIQVAVKGLGGYVIERLFNFARAHPKVVWASKTIGEWDVEMEVDLNSTSELDEIVHQIYRCGEGRVREIVTHAWGKDFAG